MSFDAKAIEVDSKVIALRHPKKETAIQFRNRAHWLHDLLHGDTMQSQHAASMLNLQASDAPQPQEDQPA